MHRIRVALVAILTLITLGLAAVPVGAVVAPKKVVIIVGPVGAGTNSYRADADVTAAAAAAAGATVVKVYSPSATWANVKAAVNGANIVVYFGHGNGYPNPYTTVEYTDRVNGWGLNRTTSGGDGDDGYSTMAYCGEKALLGTITSTDGATQRTYCTGGPITPAPNWVMIYAEACYAPGASESWDPRATEAVALAHVKNYSYPALKLGASAYFATDMYRGSATLVDLILRNPSMTYADITARGSGYDAAAQRHFAHPDLPTAQVWLQRTGTDPDYKYAFAGNPFATPGGNPGQPLPAPPTLVSRWPAPSATGISMTPTVSVRFSEPITGLSTGNMVLSKPVSYAGLAAKLTYDPATLTATLRPTSPLLPGTTYRMAMSESIKDLAGNSLTWTWWTFKTTSSETYTPARSLLFAAGTYTGYRFSSTGAVVAHKAYTLATGSGAPTTRRAATPNQSGAWYYLPSGVWAGYWIRDGAGITLR